MNHVDSHALLESISKSIDNKLGQGYITRIDIPVPQSAYQVSVEDKKESENDRIGYAYWITRTIKIIRRYPGGKLGEVIFSARRTISGEDEYQGYLKTEYRNLEEKYWTTLSESKSFQNEFDEIKALRTYFRS